MVLLRPWKRAAWLGGLALAVLMMHVPDVVAAPSQAPAYRAPEPVQDIHSHDRGFFFRFQIGPGYLTTSNDAFDLVMSGGGLDLSLALGGIVRPNLAIHATLYTLQAVSPTLSAEGTTVVADDLTLQLSMLGVGGTFYFPENYYVSTSVGIALLSLEDSEGNLDATSRRGLAQDVSAGKEWWLAPRFGLGVALGVGWHAVPDSDGIFQGFTAGVRLTGTVN